VLLPFAKYHGAGNDFILFDDRGSKFPERGFGQIAGLCDRRLGIGADGLILLQTSSVADYRMRIFNADGREAALCGNGLRCLARFIDDGRSSWRIEMPERIVSCSLHPLGASVEMGPWNLLFKDQEWEEGVLHALHTGVPHAVVPVQSLEIPDFGQRSRRIRHSPLFGPEGANVNFALKRADGSLAYRTYERGVEGETLSCGTGAAAVAAAFGQAEGFVATASGEKLFVVITENNAIVSGPAAFVFSGIINFGEPHEDRSP